MEDILLWNIKKETNTTTFLYLDTATCLMTETCSCLQIEKCRCVRLPIVQRGGEISNRLLSWHSYASNNL